MADVLQLLCKPPRGILATEGKTRQDPELIFRCSLGVDQHGLLSSSFSLRPKYVRRIQRCSACACPKYGWRYRTAGKSCRDPQLIVVRLSRGGIILTPLLWYLVAAVVGLEIVIRLVARSTNSKLL